MVWGKDHYIIPEAKLENIKTQYLYGKSRVLSEINLVSQLSFFAGEQFTSFVLYSVNTKHPSTDKLKKIERVAVIKE